MGKSTSKNSFSMATLNYQMVVIRKSQVQHGALYDHLAQQGRPHGWQEHLDHGGPGTVELRSLKGEEPRVLTRKSL